MRSKKTCEWSCVVSNNPCCFFSFFFADAWERVIICMRAVLFMTCSLNAGSQFGILAYVTVRVWIDVREEGLLAPPKRCIHVFIHLLWSQTVFILTITHTRAHCRGHSVKTMLVPGKLSRTLCGQICYQPRREKGFPRRDAENSIIHFQASRTRSVTKETCSA